MLSSSKLSFWEGNCGDLTSAAWNQQIKQKQKNNTIEQTRLSSQVKTARQPAFFVLCMIKCLVLSNMFDVYQYRSVKYKLLANDQQSTKTGLKFINILDKISSMQQEKSGMQMNKSFTINISRATAIVCSAQYMY